MESLKELYKIGRGPSSSHTMGPARAAAEFAKSYPAATRFRIVLYGSLALTGKGHLTDRAVIDAFAPIPAEVDFNVTRSDLPHPNTLEFFAYKGEALLGSEVWLSVGGGTVRRATEAGTVAKNQYPFRNFSEIMRYCKEKGCTLEQVAYDYEDADIKDFLREIWKAMRAGIRRGLVAEGKLPGTLGVDRKAKILFETVAPDEEPEEREKRLLCAFAFATSEENAGGGIIVTAPTCGASGILPAVLYYLSNKHGFSEERVLAALATAGIIGLVVKQNASVSGAEAGCQAEVGTATAMAAAWTNLLELPTTKESKV